MKKSMILKGLLGLCAVAALVIGIYMGPAQAGVSKVAICHIPPGNPDNAHVIVVGSPSIPAHLAHGDSLDLEDCGDDCGDCGGV